MSSLRILVAVDESECATQALRWAQELARLTGGTLHAVHAVGLLESSHDTHRPREHQDEAQDLPWPAGLRHLGDEARCTARYGPAADVILAVAEDVGANLIVVGTRGTGGHSERTLGSTAAQIVNRTRLPVTVIPSTTVSR